MATFEMSLLAHKKRTARHNCLPTFIGIGAMRSGSTWLAEVLKCHPDVRVADRKEMDYFFMRRMLQMDLGAYEAHFSPEDGLKPKPVRGEISPRYSRLKAWQVKCLATFLPELRVVLTLRHPVERALSQALYDFGRLQGRDVRKVRAGEFLRHLNRARSRLSSDYYRTVKIWSGSFGKDALHVELFERLQQAPEDYLNDILRHIGATTPWRLPENLREKRVFSTTSLLKQDRPIPEVVRWYIADGLLEPTERLDALLNGRVSAWVSDLRNIRARTRMRWRIAAELNRVISVPETLAYEAYHAALDARLRVRWRTLNRSYGNRLIDDPECSESKDPVRFHLRNVALERND